MVEIFTDKSGVAKEPVYEIRLSSFKPIKYIKIITGTTKEEGKRFLSFCEIETFGGESLFQKMFNVVYWKLTLEDK